MAKITFLDENYTLWRLLFQTRSALFKARQKRVGKYIHFNLAAALVTIWARDGKVTPAILSRRLFLEPHTVSELVNRMEKKDLITKKRTRKGKISSGFPLRKRGVNSAFRQYKRILSVTSWLLYPRSRKSSFVCACAYCTGKHSRSWV
jgi:hypothetical protein